MNGTINPDDEDDAPPLKWCPRRNSHCEDDLCADYGCALEAGLEPDRDETWLVRQEAVK